MGKSRARNTQRHRDTLGGKSVVKRRQHSQNGSLKKVVPPTRPKTGSQPKRAKVPFVPLDNVLLVGEGDFSFALSLVKQYEPASVIATCFDSEQELLRKYPGVKETRAQIEQDLANTQRSSIPADTHDDSFEGFSPTATDASSPVDRHHDADELDTGYERTLCRIMYGIDATKLSTVHKKVLRSFGPFTKIVFNFPHVGGLSTDVNRQVRSNQQLLVGFLNSAKCLLTHPPQAQKRHDFQEGHDTIVPKGQILVTLFEGEPYTLWNIRDLVRHCGLQVVESFKFPWSAYPGYRHARTAGDILTGRDRTNEGKRRGAWRGEERDARSYVIEVKEDDDRQVSASYKNKRRSDHSSDED
ncbi:hypothetical protein DV737_g57, partial [Chaetothyriales sp. CBS 132003]